MRTYNRLNEGKINLLIICPAKPADADVKQCTDKWSIIPIIEEIKEKKVCIIQLNQMSHDDRNWLINLMGDLEIKIMRTDNSLFYSERDVDFLLEFRHYGVIDKEEFDQIYLYWSEADAMTPEGETKAQARHDIEVDINTLREVDSDELASPES